MSDDDEYEKLIRSLESTVESVSDHDITVIEKKRNDEKEEGECTSSVLVEGEEEDDTLKEIDSFLADTVELRSGTFAVDEVKASTPKVNRTRSVSGKNEYHEMFKKIEKFQEKYSTSPEDNRPVGNIQSETTEDEKEEESVILSGNLDASDRNAKIVDRNGKILDVSILDVYDDFDDIEEITLDDVLQDITLLDSEDEGDTVDDLESTVIDVKEKKEEKKAALEEKAKPKDQKVNKKDIANIDIKYYRELEVVFQRYRNHKNLGSIPSLKDIRRPRVFRDNNKQIIGFESLEEYIDNNHPLWCDLRREFNELMVKMKTKSDLADFIHKQWGNPHPVDINQNLGCFPRKRGQQHVGRPGREHRTHDKPDTTDGHTGDQNLDTLRAMAQGASENTKLREREDERYELYTSQTVIIDSDDEEEAENKLKNCNYCHIVCFCSPRVATKRPHNDSSEGAPAKRKRLSLEDCKESVLQSLSTEQNIANIDYTAEKGANMINSVMESFNLQSCYVKDNKCHPNILKEMLSLESVYDEFEKYYRSPYARDNPPSEDSTDDLNCTKDSDDGTLPYNFIEDY